MNAVMKAAPTEMAYSGMLLKAGIVSSEVKTKAWVTTPPPMPWMRPPTTQPMSMRG